MERSPSIAPNPYRAEFLEWAKASTADGPRQQHPVDELLGEHHLMRTVIAMMHGEAKRLANHQPFRPELWVTAVEFIGNFGLLYHYRKKANHLFPTATELGLSEAIKELDKDQSIDIDLTLDIVDAVQECDWEKVLRLAVMLVSAKRQKMEQEEKTVLLPVKPLLTPELTASLRAAFDDVEKKALQGKGGRGDYLDIARTMAKVLGLPDPVGG